MTLGVKLLVVFFAFLAILVTVIAVAFRERTRGKVIAQDDVQAQQAQDARVMTGDLLRHHGRHVPHPHRGLARVLLMAFERTFQVAWAHLDANGHMANVAFLDVAVDVRFMYFESCGFPPSEWAKLRVGPVVRRDEVDYHRELRMLQPFKGQHPARGARRRRLALSHPQRIPPRGWRARGAHHQHRGNPRPECAQADLAAARAGAGFPARSTAATTSRCSTRACAASGRPSRERRT
jgi:hypothetical protein